MLSFVYMVHYYNTIALHTYKYHSIHAACAGVWNAWFLPLMKGQSEPAMPKEPATEHKQQGETVPYTDEEMEARLAKYDKTMEIWNKTIEVHRILCDITHYQLTFSLITHI
jgi:hypothetical protein